MKSTRYLLWLVLFFAAIFSACEKDKVEVPSPVNDLKTYAGKYRAKVEFKAPDQSVSGKVFYGNGKFSEFSVTDTGTVQSVIVEELPEGKQTLRVVTFNDEGQVSDPRAVYVNVFGDNYQNGLASRQLLNQSTISPTSVEIFFKEAKAGEVGVRILFTNLSGAKDSIMMTSSQTSILVNNIKLTEPYYYYSVFKPEQDAIDVFTTTRINAKEAAMLSFEKTKWTLVSFSSQEPGGDGKWALASYIIDDKVTTFWHSEVVASYAQMPHWLLVDMKSEKKFNGFHFIQSQDLNEQGLAKGFRFEVSSDNSTWKNVLEGQFTTSRYKQIFTFGEPVIARYFKITILSGFNDAFWSQIAEIDLFNEANVSGDNGVDAPKEVPLVNAKSPFASDGSDLFPAVGAGRMQKVSGWKHSDNAYITYDANSPTSITLWSAAVWGIANVTNGKIYQTVNLQPGKYVLNIDVGYATDPTCADAFGVVARGETIPDYTLVTSSADVLGYSNLMANQRTVISLAFAMTSVSPVTIGIVYNTHSLYETIGVPWSELHINGFELLIQQ